MARDCYLHFKHPCPFVCAVPSCFREQGCPCLSPCPVSTPGPHPALCRGGRCRTLAPSPLEPQDVTASSLFPLAVADTAPCRRPRDLPPEGTASLCGARPAGRPVSAAGGVASSPRPWVLRAHSLPAPPPLQASPRRPRLGHTVPGSEPAQPAPTQTRVPSRQEAGWRQTHVGCEPPGPRLGRGRPAGVHFVAEAGLALFWGAEPFIAWRGPASALVLRRAPTPQPLAPSLTDARLCPQTGGARGCAPACRSGSTRSSGSTWRTSGSSPRRVRWRRRSPSAPAGRPRRRVQAAVGLPTAAGSLAAVPPESRAEPARVSGWRWPTLSPLGPHWCLVCPLLGLPRGAGHPLGEHAPHTLGRPTASRSCRHRRGAAGGSRR